jgi:hypothetical protein
MSNGFFESEVSMNFKTKNSYAIIPQVGIVSPEETYAV